MPPAGTHLKPSRHLADTSRHFRHTPDTLQKPSRHALDTLCTLTKDPPNFSFLLAIEVREIMISVGGLVGVIFNWIFFFEKKVLVLQWSSSIDSHLLKKILFHRKLSSIKGCLPLNEGYLPMKIIFHYRSFSLK